MKCCLLYHSTQPTNTLTPNELLAAVMRWRVCEYIGLLIILTHTSAAVCVSSSRRSQLILLWLRLSEHAGREPEVGVSTELP